MNRLRELRDRALLYVYEQGAGNPNWQVDGREVEAAIGATPTEFDSVVMMLFNQGLMAQRCSVGSIGLSHAGQVEAERLRPSVRWSAEPPPPPPAAIHVHGHGNVVQTAGSHATQHATAAADARISIINDVARQAEGLGLSGTSLVDLRDQLAALRETLQGQARPAAIKTLATAAAAILKSAGGAMGSALAEKLLRALL